MNWLVAMLGAVGAQGTTVSSYEQSLLVLPCDSPSLAEARWAACSNDRRTTSGRVATNATGAGGEEVAKGIGGGRVWSQASPGRAWPSLTERGLGGGDESPEERGGADHPNGLPRHRTSNVVERSLERRRQPEDGFFCKRKVCNGSMNSVPPSGSKGGKEATYLAVMPSDPWDW